jgi:hypothetical protein
MAFSRKIVATDVYEGRRITVRYMGPDLLCEVEGIELAGFYLNTEGAYGAAHRYIDAEIKEEKRHE